MEPTPKLIEGGVFSDDRGLLQFVNDFDMTAIKRMYFTTHPLIETVRAWQGHKIEKRWFFCVKGAFKINLVKIDDWENPSNNCKVFEFKLEENKPQVLYTPNGFANGFKAIEENSKLMMLSDHSLNQVENDNYRFDSNKWVNWEE
jgi:dTDP-4-dehydrorhamnose 3,5-epimerase